MMEINVTEAKAKLSHIVGLAEMGETITITRLGKPVAQLTPPGPPKLAAEQAKARLGFVKEEFHVPTDEEWRQMDEEICEMFYESLDAPEPKP